MKKTVFVYIVFVFLLMSFAGFGKLKDSSVSRLTQTDTSATPAQISEPSNTSIKDLTEEEILELTVETLERKLALLNPRSTYDVEELQ